MHRAHVTPIGPIAWRCDGGHEHALSEKCPDDYVPAFIASWVFNKLIEECDCDD